MQFKQDQTKDLIQEKEDGPFYDKYIFLYIPCVVSYVIFYSFSSVLFLNPVDWRKFNSLLSAEKRYQFQGIKVLKK